MLNFHPDFFCIHQHHKEVPATGVLFNNIYQPPFIRLADKDVNAFCNLVAQMQTEMQNVALAQYEVLVSYLKIFLINASRLRVDQNQHAASEVSDLKEPFVLQNLKDAIEDNFKTKHSPARLCDMLIFRQKHWLRSHATTSTKR